MTVDPSPAIDDATVAAIERSHLAVLPADVRVRLFERARAMTAPAGSYVHAEGEQEPHLDLVIDGLARAFVTAPDGRTLTVRYCRSGALLGAVSLYARPFTMPATVQCLVETRFLRLDPAQVREEAARDPASSRALLDELAERVAAFIAEIPAGAFASVEERVARHLLDLASEHQVAERLSADLSQQELADAVGTSREVVVRVLRGLRADGLIETGRGRIIVTDARGLLGRTYDAAGEWNTGS